MPFIPAAFVQCLDFRTFMIVDAHVHIKGGDT